MKVVEVGQMMIDGELKTIYKEADEIEKFVERHRRYNPEQKKHYKYYKPPIKERISNGYKRNKYWIAPALGTAAISIAASLLTKGICGFMNNARAGYLESDTVITDPDYTIR